MKGLSSVNYFMLLHKDAMMSTAEKFMGTVAEKDLITPVYGAVKRKKKRTTKKLAEVVSLLTPATDLASDKRAQATDESVVGFAKLSI